MNTQSFDYIRPIYEDFFNSSNNESNRTENFYIECIFEDLKSHEASSFLEWLGFYDDGKSFLKIWLSAKRKDRKIFYEIRSGADDEGSQLSAEARDYLRVTYLKALRDAESELSPKKLFSLIKSSGQNLSLSVCDLKILCKIKKCKNKVIDIIDITLRDNVNLRKIKSDGSYENISNTQAFNAHDELYKYAKKYF